MNDQTLNSLKTPTDAPADARADAPADAALQENASSAEALRSEEDSSSRRRALRTLGKLGFGAALLGAGSFLSPRVAQAQGMDGDAPTVLEILNFALTLEYLERAFYNKGVDSGVIPGDAMPIFTLIRDHERSHVDFLRTAIMQNTDGEPVMFNDDDFDFTGGNGNGDGPFDPFNDYATFLTLSQGFEDTGVRAYKGQAPHLLGDENETYLNAALRIHSVEARHAAEVRGLREGVEPWIEGDGDTDNTPLEAVYAAGMPPDMYPPEENVVQGGVDLVADLDAFKQYTDNPAEAASAAFDEPLDMVSVLNIADPFIPGDQGMANAVTLDFSNVFGVLNYAYALEQLEAAFYGQVVASPFEGATDEEMDVLNDIWDHERAHREFFEAKISSLDGGDPIGGLTPDFSMVDFSDRNSVLQTALTFEDIGVSAYNGAASLIEMVNPIKAAGDIVSVEARHAATLRDLMDPSENYFGGTYALDDEYVIDDNGLDEARSPSEVLPAVQPFVQNEITATNLPSGM